MTDKILNFILAVFALAGVILALRTITLTRELHSFQIALPEKNYMTMLQAVFNDAKTYEKTHPDIQPVLAPFETKAKTSK